MRDHDDRQAEEVAQLAHQFVDLAGALGVEAGGRLVEKQQFGVERQGTRQRRALHHAAAEFGRILRADLRLETGHGQLPGGDFVDQAVIEPGVLAQRQANIFADGQRAKQAAALEHHPPAQPQSEGGVVAEVRKVDAEYPDGTRVRPLQQDHLAQQRRLAGAAATDQGEDLRTAYLQVDFGMHDDQQIERTDTECAQGVDLLGHRHGADLRCVGGTRAPGDDDGGDQGRELAQHRQADEIGNKNVGSVLPELVGALIGDDDSEQERQQSDDRQGVDAGAAQVVEDRQPAKARRLPDAAGKGDGNLPDEAEQRQRLADRSGSAVPQFGKLARRRSGKRGQGFGLVADRLPNHLEQSGKLRGKVAQLHRAAFAAQPQ